MSMTAVTRLTGAVLILIGVIAYLVSDAASITALIPALLGLILLGMGMAAARDAWHRHAIHAALAVALLGLLASLPRALASWTVVTGGDVERPVAALASLAVVVVCAVYVALGARSFVAARRTN